MQPLALERDRRDPLRALRDAFELPVDSERNPVSYLCGHSLGPLVRSTRALIEEELDVWGQSGIGGYTGPPRPWMRYAHDLRVALARLVGAQPGEVAVMNSLTVNLHLLLARFYEPRGQRRKILIDAPVFPSDRMAVASQIAWRGGDPKDDLIVIGPRPGESVVDPDALVEAIQQAGETLALVFVGGVNYLNGQRLPLGLIARAAHASGVPCGVDLAHAIGNVPLALNQDEIDFAVWCSYKYLNGGPGAVGGLYVRQDPSGATPDPALKGWWGHEEKTRFLMGADFSPEEGALGFAVSNVPVLATTPLHAALALFDAHPLDRLIEKREALIGHALHRLGALGLPGLSVITPLTREAHGGQLSFSVGPDWPRGTVLIEALARCGVIADWREPAILRVAFHPLYNSFEDAERLVEGLGRIHRKSA